MPRKLKIHDAADIWIPLGRYALVRLDPREDLFGLWLGVPDGDVLMIDWSGRVFKPSFDVPEAKEWRTTQQAVYLPEGRGEAIVAAAQLLGRANWGEYSRALWKELADE